MEEENTHRWERDADQARGERGTDQKKGIENKGGKETPALSTWQRSDDGIGGGGGRWAGEGEEEKEEALFKANEEEEEEEEEGLSKADAVN